jgi:hypothetical protein
MGGSLASRCTATRRDDEAGPQVGCALEESIPDRGIGPKAIRENRFRGKWKRAGSTARATCCRSTPVRFLSGALDCRPNDKPKTRGPAPSACTHLRMYLCHGLCHNRGIPAGVGPSRAVSLRHTQKAVTMPKPHVNTAPRCRSVSLCICPYQFTLGNGMEEVVGSIPTRSTNLAHPLGANFLLR